VILLSGDIIEVSPKTSTTVMSLSPARVAWSREIHSTGARNFQDDMAMDAWVSQGAVSEGYECTNQSKPSQNNLGGASPRR
jgi:hypothetical protein